MADTNKAARMLLQSQTTPHELLLRLLVFCRAKSYAAANTAANAATYDVSTASLSNSNRFNKSVQLQSETLEELMQPYPSVQRWMQRVQEAVGPEYDAVNQVLSKTTARFVARKQRQQTASSKL